MSTAPQHDWSYVAALSRESENARLRAMSPQDKFAVVADMFNTIWTARKKIHGDWEALAQRRWQEKLVLHQRMVEAFRKLDEWRCERTAAGNSH